MAQIQMTKLTRSGLCRGLGWGALACLLACATVLGGSLRREVFTDLIGNSVEELTNSPNFPELPSHVTEVSSFASPIDVGDFYGQRIHGYISPPVSGAYMFWISSDDNSVLYLSSDETPANAVEIATVRSWSSFREWTKEPNQQSLPVLLKAGKLYYVSALMKEGSGGDHVEVRWLRPDGFDEGPIPGRTF